MQKYTKSQMQKMLWTIFYVMSAAISTHPIASIDVDVVITPAQAQVHWHCELNKKHVRGRQKN
jgi:hypothetical protein